ncbi:MAG: hypothetical protein ABFR95_00705 [Actinomycetota bacterium]
MTPSGGRKLPSWMPDPIDSIGLFVFEIAAVGILAAAGVVTAIIALWLV